MSRVIGQLNRHAFALNEYSEKILSKNCCETIGYENEPAGSILFLSSIIEGPTISIPSSEAD
jgi:hypothetical protein